MIAHTAALPLLLLLGCAQAHLSPTPSPQAARVAATATALPSDGPVCTADVLTVHDGDSIYVRLYLDDECDRRMWLRLRGVFAPELSEPGGDAARAKLAALVPPGSHVTVRRFTVRSPKRWPVLLKSFDRYVSDVTTEGGVSVNEAVK